MVLVSKKRNMKRKKGELVKCLLQKVYKAELKNTSITISEACSGVTALANGRVVILKAKDLCKVEKPQICPRGKARNVRLTAKGYEFLGVTKPTKKEKTKNAEISYDESDDDYLKDIGY